MGVPFFSFFFFFFFVLYLRYMNEGVGGGEEREKEIVMDGYMLMNKKMANIVMSEKGNKRRE